jgi:hypothetical protein
MPLTAYVMELLAQWCAISEEMADIRAKARSEFFGYDEPGTIQYMEGSGDIKSRERRFLGWWFLNGRLADGRRPAELAAAALLKGDDLTPALKSIRGVRYVIAVVTMVAPGKGIFLEIEDEEFEVVDRYLSLVFSKDEVICAHVLPIGRNRWVAGPGWLSWPTQFGPGIRANLKKFQMGPIEVEKFLQQRDREKHKVELGPLDKTLKEAVARMTEAAKAEGKSQLILSEEEWSGKVLAIMKTDDFNAFNKEIVKRLGKVSSVDEINKWLGIAVNIWNNTPQPDRGNKSAIEIRDEFERQKKGETEK